ncbi:MAG: serine hydrolase [Caldilineaceae bacterium]
MWYANRIAILLLAVLLLCACQPVTRLQAPAAQPPQGLRFDAPEYAVDGPYTVGVRYFTIPAKMEQDRELTATVWYPAEKSDDMAAGMEYEQQFAPGEIAPFSVFGHAVVNAPSDASGAPYPLVVYSHGHWSYGQELPYLTEHLASRGFVVISVDHEDNWSTAFGPLAYQAMVRRPQEVTREIDFAEALTAPGGGLANMIETSKVGITGWSLGADTALSVAGARWDLANAAKWCAEAPGLAEEYGWLCADLVGHSAEMAEFAGLSETPQGLWPPVLDSRVRAVAPLAPSPLPFGGDGLRSLTIPVLMMIGSGELASDPVFKLIAPYDSIGSERKSNVVLDHGEHMLFFSSCDNSPSITELGFPSFCTDPVWDMDRGHDLINHFVTAFLLSELKGDTAAASVLAPENVSFSGVQYEAAGYNSTATTPKPALDAATTATIDAIVQQAMAGSPIPGFQMCVVKDGEVVYNKGFGLADVAAGKPMTPQSIMIQASVSKTLTAVAVLRLVEQGKLDLDARITDYLPYFTMADGRYKDITMRMLLSHRSGLPDTPGYWDTPLDSTIDPLEQSVRWLADKQLLFEPGTDWSYSDKNFAALGAIIAVVTGKQYETYMQEEWLTPLGMTHSTFVLGDVDPAQRVEIYDSDAQGNAVPTPSQCDERDAPACTLASTCDDMARWAEFLLNKGEVNGARLLEPASIDAMWTSLSHTPWYDALGDYYGPLLEGYGLGWYVGEKDGHRSVGHAGGINGANTQIQLAPDDGLAVIAMDNWLDLDNPTYPAGFADFDVLYHLLGIQPQ